MNFKSFFSLETLKRYWAPLAVTIVLVGGIFGGTIAGIYAKARAKVPALPAPK